MARFNLLNYADENGEARPGLGIGDEVIDLGEAVAAHERATGTEAGFSAATTLAVLDRWDAALPILEAVADGSGDVAARPLSSVRLLAPILYPGAIYNAISNYAEHQKEMSGALDKSEVTPYFFLKSGRHTVIGPEAEIRLPKVSNSVDWEAELGVVIGRPARNMTVENALDCVAGYTIFNDLSARDLSRPPGRRHNIDWFAHKNFDGSGPLGPWITPARDIPDPYAVTIKLWVNDELMQDAVTSQMFFNIHEQIEYLSRRMTLRPGDVIATGTPSGVGRPRGIFLKPGDTVTIELGGIGTLRNPVVQGE
jgi:2-keto-4-pentenoate hydratase/2-oxohepta-3-ene-1,7-dioic acid hydratase in catechol pathway